MSALINPNAGTDSAPASNRSLIYGIIWRESPISRSDLVRRTGLMKSTVSSNVDELLARGLVEETGYRASGVAGGRRAILLRINANSHVVSGIHLGVRQTTVVIADALGNELGVYTSSTMRRSPSSTLTAAAETIKRLLNERDIPLEKLSAVGVALPGLVDHRTGTCRIAPNLGWRNVKVADALTSALGVPVFVNNTTQAMAVAESHWASQDHGSSDLALLYIGTGVGSALVDHGRLFRGSGGFAGEIGHVSVGSGIACPCGNIGCLETLVSGPAIARRALAAGVKTPQSRRTISPETIGRAAAAGDTAARELLASVGKELGHVTAWLIQITNPSSLVIAGGVSALGDLLIDPLREGIREAAMPEVFDTLTIRRSYLDSRGKLRGAVLIALQQLDEPVQSLPGSRLENP